MATILELQICQLHPREYEVRVLKAAAGGEHRAPLDLKVDELLEQRPELENKVVHSAEPTRRAVRPSEQLVQRVGRQLFDALFSNQILGIYRASLSAAQVLQERLQIVLRLEPPELALLPWESLYDSDNDSYVCLREPVVRHVPSSHTLNPLPVQPPLRILAVVASPRGLPLLDTDAERARLEEALAGVDANSVELVWLTDASWTSLHNHLIAGPWHVIHFIGHGDYDLHYGEGQIALVGENGRAQMVEASRLAHLIGLANPTPRLVVLNSCVSGKGGAGDGFSSAGAALVRSGINAVAAMQFSITDPASVLFAHGFYTALAAGRRVDDAVRSGRISMLGAGKSLEWITPVLYVRGEANLLFNLTAQRQPPKGSHEDKVRLRQLYTEASEKLRIGHLGKAIELLDKLLSFDPGNSDAITLRDQAARQEQLIKVYDRAVEAEDSEEWSAAIDCYEQIIQEEPDYRDTVTRLDFCRDRQRIAHLQKKLRSHASQEQWKSVLEVTEELDQLDPTDADPDGLSTRARQEIAKEQYTAYLENLYTQAFEAQRSEDWNTAIDCYEQIIQGDPDYRDTVTRLDFCRDRQRIAHLQKKLRSHASQEQWKSVLEVTEELDQLDPTGADPDGLSTRARQEIAKEQYTAYLENLYTQAFEAQRSEDWNTAIDCYEQIIQGDPDYRDTVTRLDFCRDRRRIARNASSVRNSPVIFTRKTLVIAAPCGAMAWGSSGQRQSLQALAVDILTDEKICIYDLSGAELLNIKTGEKGPPYIAAFSPDGTHLVGKGKKGATIWNAYTGKKLLHIPAGKGVAAADFNPDGTCLATGSYDLACVWDAETAEKIFWAEQQPVQAVAFSPDGNRLIVADQWGLHVWQVDTAEKIFEDRRSFLSSVAYSPDGKRAAAGSSTDSKAYLWNPGQVYELAHNAPVISVAFSPDGTRLATGSEDGKVRIWDASNAHMMRKIHHDDPVSSLAFSPGGTRLATGTRRAVTVWALRYF